MNSKFRQSWRERSAGEKAVQPNREFLRITFGQVTDVERRRVRQHLEEYCEQDTMGMVDNVKSLKLLAG